jgi:hypothetical protein
MLTEYAKSILARKSGAARGAKFVASSTPARAPGVAAAAAPAHAADPLPDSLAGYPALMKPCSVALYFAISVDQVMAFKDSGGELDFINLSPSAARPTWRIKRESVARFERRRQTSRAKLTDLST